MNNEKEIPFGVFDSELMHQEIFIPEGFEATIDGDKIILTRKDSEDERIRKELIGYIVKEVGLYPGEDRKEHKWLRWLEKQGEPQDKGEISDGYHTFNELYYYRMLYNAAFFNMLPKEWVHKSKKHHDGEDCFGGGWFIVMANLPTGQISNHYELKDWDLFQIPEKEVADKWDGHTPQEAADRLHKYLLEKQDKQPSAIRWYDVSLIPQEMEELLVEWDSEDATWHEIAFYHADTKTFWNGTRQVENVTRWCYITDLLEKQDEQELPIEKLPEEMKTIGESLGFTTQEECDEYNQMVSELIMSDKVEPKFKVGDWIIDDKNRVGIIVRILDEHYIISFDGREVQISFEWEGKLFRKWSIKDAKDGDVIYFNNDISGFHSIGLFKRLASKNEINSNTYRCYARYGGFNEENRLEIAQKNDELCHFGTEACPATKEQRDLLFSKMKEAGYEWDENNKMLKEIVEDEEEPQNYKNQIMSEITDLVKHYIKQKPTCGEAGEDMKEALRTEYEKGRADAFAQMQKEWSEEDEIKIKSIVAFLKSPSLCAMDGNKGIIDANIKYLKSIKDRVQPQDTWKPSEEQMRALEYIIDNAHNTSYSCKIAKELLEQLRKLKGE